MTRRRPARSTGGSFLSVLLSTGLIAACGCAGAPPEPKPVPSLASSPQAAAAFDEIRQTWTNAERSNPAPVRELLERFLGRFPNDGLIPLARVYLAIVAL